MGLALEFELTVVWTPFFTAIIAGVELVPALLGEDPPVGEFEYGSASSTSSLPSPRPMLLRSASSALGDKLREEPVDVRSSFSTTDL